MFIGISKILLRISSNVFILKILRRFISFMSFPLWIFNELLLLKATCSFLITISFLNRFKQIVFNRIDRVVNEWRLEYQIRSMISIALGISLVEKYN